MNSEKPKSLDGLNIDPSDAAADSEANATDLNDSSHDSDNVDTPISETSSENSQTKVFDSKREMIRRLGG